MITPQQALARLLDNNELFHDEMSGLMRQIMSAQVAPEMVAALLVALRMKVETVAEIAAAAGVMREFATRIGLGEEGVAHQMVAALLAVDNGFDRFDGIVAQALLLRPLI